MIREQSTTYMGRLNGPTGPVPGVCSKVNMAEKSAYFIGFASKNGMYQEICDCSMCHSILPERITGINDLIYAHRTNQSTKMPLLALHALEFPEGIGGRTIWEVASALVDGQECFQRKRARDGNKYSTKSNVPAGLGKVVGPPDV